MRQPDIAFRSQESRGDDPTPRLRVRLTRLPDNILYPVICLSDHNEILVGRVSDNYHVSGFGVNDGASSKQVVLASFR